MSVLPYCQHGNQFLYYIHVCLKKHWPASEHESGCKLHCPTSDVASEGVWPVKRSSRPPCKPKASAEVEKRKGKEIQRSEVLNKSNCCCIWWTWREMNGWFVMLIKAEPSAEQDSLAARPSADTSNWCYQHGNRAAFACSPHALLGMTAYLGTT